MKKLITRHKIGEFDLRVTRDSVQAAGYEIWIAVRYMTTNEKRIDACEWYVGLIAKGIIKKENKI